MSEVKVNKISPKTACGTVTLGDSGDTIAIGAGVTTSGMGRTGTVDWQTGSIKTSTFTPTNGEGYFCNTTGGAFAVTLPVGVAGNIVAFADYTRTFTANKLTLTPNGSEKIGGVNDDAFLDVSGQSATFLYVDSTEGWINVQETQTSVLAITPTYITATGGTPLTVGDYKTHIFTGPGCFQVTCKGNDGGSETLEYFIVGAGGGAGTNRGAGGGAGGFRMYSTAPGSNSPLNGSGGVTASVTTYPIAVSAGGAGNGPVGPPQPSSQASAGGVSSGLGLTGAGGGFGGNNTPCAQIDGGTGGSGGGGGGQACSEGGAGNTPPTSPAQGTDGGDDSRPGTPGEAGGGGGGAAVAGTNSSGGTSGIGGAGSYLADPFIGPTAPSYGEPGPESSTRYFSGGGGGNSSTGSGGVGGVGGGGDAGAYPGNGSNGVVNTGGGGGGGGFPGTGGTGGSGIVMIRYKFQ